jgi:hypothetical protein
MFFNIIVDILAILIAWAKEDGQEVGLIPQLVEGGVFILPLQKKRQALAVVNAESPS